MSTEKAKKEGRVTERVYEALFIFNSDLFARNPEGIPAQVAKEITDRGGEVLVSRLWEERRLAYPIEGQRRGTYWLTYFRSGTDAIKELTRQFQITDNILRFLFVKLEPKLVDVLVEYARTGTFYSEAEASLDGAVVAAPVAAVSVAAVPVAEMDEDGDSDKKGL